MMKRAFSLILAFALLLAVAPHAARADDPAAWYREEALSMTASLRELAGDGEYVKLFTISEELSTLTASWSEALAGELLSDRLIVLPSEKLLTAVARKLANLSADAEISDAAMKKIYKGLPQTIFTVFNGAHGEMYIAASAIVNVSRAYQAPEDFVNAVVLLNYEGVSVLVSFLEWEDGVVVASAYCGAPLRDVDLLDVLQ